MTFHFMDSSYWTNVFQVNLLLIFVHLNCCDSLWVFLFRRCMSLSGNTFFSWVRHCLGVLSVIPFFFFDDCSMRFIHSMQNKIFIQSIALSFNFTLMSKWKILALLVELFWYFMFYQICTMFCLFDWVLAQFFNKNSAEIWNDSTELPFFD